MLFADSAYNFSLFSLYFLERKILSFNFAAPLVSLLLVASLDLITRIRHYRFPQQWLLSLSSNRWLFNTVVDFVLFYLRPVYVNHYGHDHGVSSAFVSLLQHFSLFCWFLVVFFYSIVS